MSRFLEHVKFVREHSAYYRELYKNVSQDCEDISCYPIIHQSSFWKANENFGEGVLTSKHESGIVFKSGGTSGNPKYSDFSAQEWDDFTAVSGRGFRHNGIKQGDRIANLFYAGELYASFIYVTDLIKSADVGVSYPIGGHTPKPEIVKIIQKLNINVIAGVPTTIMNIIAYLQEHPDIKLNIDLILFGGEFFYDDQLELISHFFTKAKVHSILYASVDGGELGYFDASSCKNGEHRVFDESTIMEIVDEETLEVIKEENVAGKLLVTNLNRKLMPLIRYPVGDIAIWCESEGTKNRKFKLLGRSQEGARVGPATLYIQDIVKIFEHFKEEVHILNFQIIITHESQKDRAVIKVVPEHSVENPKELSKKIINYLYDERNLLKMLLANNIIHPITLEWSHPEDLQSNPRTGKTKRILDRRLEK
jgi:phenylacetate-CoA ligase